MVSFNAGQGKFIFNSPWQRFSTFLVSQPLYTLKNYWDHPKIVYVGYCYQHVLEIKTEIFKTYLSIHLKQ